MINLMITALLPFIAGYQLLPSINKTFIFQKRPRILKAFCRVFILLTLEIVLPCMLDFGCLFWSIYIYLNSV